MAIRGLFGRGLKLNMGIEGFFARGLFLGAGPPSGGAGAWLSLIFRRRRRGR